MSLINKMLQDLESRKNTQAEAANKKSVYEDLKSIKASGFRAPSRRLTALLLVIVMLGAGAYAWMQWGDRLFSGDVATVTPPPVAVRKASPKPAPAPAPVAPTTVAAAPAPEAKVAPATPAAASAEKSGEAPVKKEQTGAAPPAAKAETRAETVPAPAAPKKVSAPNSGYWTVARGETLYGISAKTGIDLWDLSNWNRLGREHVIQPGQRLRLTPPASSEAKSDVKQPKEPKEQKKKETGKEKISVASAEKPRAKGAASKAAAVTAPSSDPGQADASVMDKKVKPLSSEEQAESEYRQAANLLQQGRASDAERRLRSALNISAEHTKARELLAGLTLQNGRWREAQQILEQGIAKVPAYYPFALLLARVHVEHGMDQKALSVMEGSRQAGAGNADFMAFLAEMYRRAGKHADAVKAYTEAIKLNPQEGRSWLGLGISLEASQDWSAAGEAYQRAIETGTLDDNLLKYARQRQAIVKNK